MTFTTVPLLATGDWIDAAWGNTYWKDNFAALWPYTTAGDLAYGTGAASNLARLALTTGGVLYGGASAPAWLAKPSVDSVLKNTTAGVPSWLALADVYPVTATKTDATGHSYSSTTVRDMPNSSGTITPKVTSTVLVVASVEAYNGTGNCFFQYKIRLNGVDNANYAVLHFSNGIVASIAAVARFTGVTSGAKTLVLREREAYGAGVGYNVVSLQWTAVAIPE